MRFQSLYAAWAVGASIRLLSGLLLVVLGSAVAGGCQRPVTQQYTPPVPAEPVATRPEMVFLSFQATSDGTKPATFTLLNRTVVAGTFKAEPASEVTAPAYLVLSQLDAAQNTLTSTVLEHPLLKSVEAFGDDGQPSRRTVALQKAEFFVRLALAPQARAVRIDEFVNSKKTGATDFPFPAQP